MYALGMILTAIYSAATIAAILAGLVSWLREKPIPQDELDRASMRSMSWPTAPGQSWFHQAQK